MGSCWQGSLSSLLKEQMQIPRAHQCTVVPLVLSVPAFPGHHRCRLVPATEKSKVKHKGQGRTQGHLLSALRPSEALFKSELSEEQLPLGRKTCWSGLEGASRAQPGVRHMAAKLLHYRGCWDMVLGFNLKSSFPSTSEEMIITTFTNRNMLGKARSGSHKRLSPSFL